MWAKGVEILISFNFQDVHLAEALQASMFMLEPDKEIILSPASYEAVLFSENIAGGVYESDAFVFLMGPNGISRWQEIELDVALNRRSREPSFSIVPVLGGNAAVPDILLPYHLNWLKLPVITDRIALRLLFDAIKRSTESSSTQQTRHWE